MSRNTPNLRLFSNQPQRTKPISPRNIGTAARGSLIRKGANNSISKPNVQQQNKTLKVGVKSQTNNNSLSKTQQISVRPKNKLGLNPKAAVIKAINHIFNHESDMVQFIDVFEAADKIQDSKEVYDVYSEAKGVFAEKLKRLKIDSVSELIKVFKEYMKEVNQIQSFMRFIGIKMFLAEKKYLPEWKYNENIKKQNSYCVLLAIEVWNEEIHPNVMARLGGEISTIFESIITNKTADLLNSIIEMFGVLGHNYNNIITEMFKRNYLGSMFTDHNDKLDYILRETQRMSQYLPMNELQNILLIPNLGELLIPLLQVKSEKVVEIKDFLCLEYQNIYNDLVIDFMKKQEVPVDYFSLSGFYNYFSHVSYSPEPVKAYVKNYINNFSNNFAVLFVSVVFAHIDFPDNLTQISNLPDLYSFPDILNNELHRVLMIKLLRERDISAVTSIIPALSKVFPKSTMMTIDSIVRDFKVTEHFIYVNKSLWKPLIKNDSIHFPTEITKVAQEELAKIKHPNQEQFLSAVFTQVIVRALYHNEKNNKKLERTYTMTALQLSMIRMYEAGNHNFTTIDASEDILETAQNLLRKSGIIDDKNCIVNTAPKAKKINIYDASVKIVRKVDPVPHKPDINVDNSHCIQASIMKILKKDKKLIKEHIIKKVRDDLPPKYNINDDAIRTQLGKLAKQQLIKIEQNVYYVYI